MKKFIYIFTIILSVSCSSDIEELNVNVKDPAVVPGDALFTSAQKALVDQMVSTNVNINIYRLIMQQWTQTTYTDESNYDLVTRTIPQEHWDVMYRDVLIDLKDAYRIIEETPLLTTEDPDVKTNKLAIIEVLNVYTFAVLVDTFGNVPYSEALDIDNLLPVYDDGLTIYQDLITRLNNAINSIEISKGSFDVPQDNMYQGDTFKWFKFANSLKLRLGITLADIASETTLASTTIESAAPNVFDSNADNAALNYLSSTPNTNPLYVDLVLSGRKDFIPASTIVDQMNTFNDPRRQFYFTPLSDGTYQGGTPGASNSYSNYSHISELIANDPTFEGTLMDYAEVSFLLAEASERGFNVGGTAETYYNQAITASILYWGGSATDASNYLAQPEVAYSTANGDWKEKIGIQKWIGLYNRGFAAWNSWKLLDYPVLEAPADPVSETPVRFTFPIVEQTLNGDSYNAASTAIGGDAVTTKLFWDLN
ncbi:SusD/RagB family nutrient-binding outer membrane lipoprotein [Aquimarina rhabdastrellae]